MPKENTAIHLDMIFTQIDRELCIVFPPHFIGPERLPVLHWRKGEATIHERPNIFAALAACDMPIEPVFCGGEQAHAAGARAVGVGLQLRRDAAGRDPVVSAQRGDAARAAAHGLSRHHRARRSSRARSGSSKASAR